MTFVDILAHIDILRRKRRGIQPEVIQEELGFVPKFGLSAGWKDTVQEMRRSGEL
jgi:hypothetical protein